MDIGSWGRNWSPKGRGGRRRGWSPPGKGDRSLTQPRRGLATRRLLQRMGLAGAAANSSAWGKFGVPMSCSSPRSAPAQTGRRPGKPPGRDCAGGHGRPCGLRKPEPARNDAGRWEMARLGSSLVPNCVVLGCKQFVFPLSITLQHNGVTQRAHKVPGTDPVGAASVGAEGAGMGHEAAAAQLEKKILGFPYRPQIQPGRVLVQGGCLQSITSLTAALRGKWARGHAGRV